MYQTQEHQKPNQAKPGGSDGLPCTERRSTRGQTRPNQAGVMDFLVPNARGPGAKPGQTRAKPSVSAGIPCTRRMRTRNQIKPNQAKPGPNQAGVMDFLVPNARPGSPPILLIKVLKEEGAGSPSASRAPTCPSCGPSFRILGGGGLASGELLRSLIRLRTNVS